MSKEIERKFLVAELPDLTHAKKALVRQGYLTAPGDSTELRLRQKNESYFLTLKGSGGMVRVEREAELTAAQFQTFWPETTGRRVEKDRFTGALPDGRVFELDRVQGRSGTAAIGRSGIHNRGRGSDLHAAGLVRCRCHG